MAVHENVPIESAVEDRMQRTRALHIRRAGHDMVELVRIFATHMPERNAREVRGEFGGHGGAHRNASTVISAMFAASMISAVGACTLITALRGSEESRVGKEGVSTGGSRW